MSKKSQPRKIYEEVDPYIHLFDSDIRNVAAMLNDLCIRHTGYESLHLELVSDYDDGHKVILRGTRDETAEEVEKRLLGESEYKQRQIDSARKLLKDLGEL